MIDPGYSLHSSWNCLGWWQYEPQYRQVWTKVNPFKLFVVPIPGSSDMAMHSTSANKNSIIGWDSPGPHTCLGMSNAHRQNCLVGEMIDNVLSSKMKAGAGIQISKQASMPLPALVRTLKGEWSQYSCLPIVFGLYHFSLFPILWMTSTDICFDAGPRNISMLALAQAADQMSQIMPKQLLVAKSSPWVTKWLYLQFCYA